MINETMSNDAILGALIGGSFAVLGTILSHLLVKWKERSEKYRASKSLVLSNVIFQVRNIEKAVDILINLKIFNYILKSDVHGKKISYLSVEHLEGQIFNLRKQLDEIWEINNRSDIDLIANIAILQSLSIFGEKKLVNSVYKFIGWNMEDINVTDVEANAIHNGLVKYKEFSSTVKQKSLADLYEYHNAILNALNAESLSKN